MKIALIWSSPNMDGLTAGAKDAILKGFKKDESVQIEQIHLNRLAMGHCMACQNGWGTCRESGVCALKDDFASAYEKLMQADGIVWVSAVYWSGMTEAMKAFADRLRRCEASHNHFLSRKRCMLVACAGGTGRGSLECLIDMERLCTHMGMQVLDRLSVVRANRDYMLPALEKAGENYVQKVRTEFI